MAKSKEAAETKEAEEAKEAVATDEPVQEDALIKITAGLPAVIAEKVQRLLASMDPNKPGFEEMGGARWSAPIVKVHQPTSGDVPGNSKQGDLYTDTGDMLLNPLEIIPIYMHYSRARFEPGNSNPTCRSEDAKRSVYGDQCADCPDLPFRDGKKTNCNNSIEVYAFNKDCTQLYRIQFAKTSYKAGSKLYKQASSSLVPWARVYALSTEKKTRQNDTGIYYILTLTPTGEQSDEQLYPLMQHVYEKVSAVRKQVLARVEERASTGQKVVDNLPSDFGGGSDTPKDGKKGGGKADFTDM